MAGVNSAKGWHGFILVLEGFSWLRNTCNEQIRNQRKPNKTKIKPITVTISSSDTDICVREESVVRESWQRIGTRLEKEYLHP